jgi:hypothetical protein
MPVHRRIVATFLIIVPIGASVAQTGRAPATTADVPVAKVVLFSSGVGYFEHAGTVRGNGATELRFKTNQINDILKSIVLQDQDGGRVGAITYPSQDPLTKTLKSFQVDITGNPSMPQLLNQLRGARVTVQVQAERLTGTVLGVEPRHKAAERSELIVDVPVLNLLTGAMIRSVELPSITSLSLDDPQLQDELAKALASLSHARDQDKKPVTINFAGTGDRRVRIGYVVETPIWKTSYRLLLPDKGTNGRVQGWAIVENQTESDWSDVSLSLVSGRPISFMMDLYQPLYATRPTVVPELYAGLRPQVYEGATADSNARVAMAPAAAPALKLRGPMSNERRIGYGPDGRPLAVQLSEIVVTSTGASANLDAAASVASLGSSGALGELFQYTVGNVTLARQKSAMLPIITDSIDLERVSIYNASVLRSNPLNGLRLKNTTGKHLLQGPVTVLDKGSYAGDAQIDNVPPGQERLLSYGIDLDIAVDNTKNSQMSSVETAKINHGSLIIQRKLVSTQEYAANNKGTRDKMLVIEHPIRSGWKLIDTLKPAETTPSLYRFKGNAVAGKVTVLLVKEELVQSEVLGMASVDIAQLVRYGRTGEIPQNVRDAIGKAIQLKQAMLDVEQQIAARARQIAEITNEQNRMRENMKAVAQNTQYYERLLAKLNEQESSIENLQKERDALTARVDTQRRELDDYLNTLTIG